MKKLPFFILITFIFCAKSYAQLDFSSEELQQVYLGVLQENGIEGWIDEDGDVQFEIQDNAYFIGIYEDDPEFFQLAMFNIWPIETDTETTQTLAAIDFVNRDHKVVKGYTIEDNVWLAAEMFITSPFEASLLFERSLEALDEALITFISEMTDY